MLNNNEPGPKPVFTVDDLDECQLKRELTDPASVVPPALPKIKLARMLVAETNRIAELVKAYNYLEFANKALTRAYMPNAFMDGWELSYNDLIAHLGAAIEEQRRAIQG